MRKINIRDSILGRRTIFDYKPEKIDHNLLISLFNDAAYAPNHHMKEPWKLKVYQDEARLVFGRKIVESYIRLGLLNNLSKEDLEKARRKYDRFFYSIPHHILFYMDKENDAGYQDDENYAAVCAFIQNFQLLAWEKGIGTMWTAKPVLLDEIFIKAVGLSAEKQRLIAVLQVGYPNKIPRSRGRKRMDDSIEWIQSQSDNDERNA
ncbi:nitroreductase [Lentibacillus halophilus]|uniref:Nitroreductase n=1 Tax=Lentibacillus halophilus TaxID=295065 RepID=A0ABN0Z2L0_9BACI